MIQSDTPLFINLLRPRIKAVQINKRMHILVKVCVFPTEVVSNRRNTRIYKMAEVALPPPDCRTSIHVPKAVAAAAAAATIIPPARESGATHSRER